MAYNEYVFIEQEALDTMARQEALIEQYSERADKLVDAEIAFKRDYAKASAERRSLAVSPKATDKVVDEYATIETIAQREAYLAARAKEGATKMALYAMGARLDTLRSLMASHRAITS